MQPKSQICINSDYIGDYDQQKKNLLKTQSDTISKNQDRKTFIQHAHIAFYHFSILRTRAGPCKKKDFLRRKMRPLTTTPKSGEVASLLFLYEPFPKIVEKVGEGLYFVFVV